LDMISYVHGNYRQAGICTALQHDRTTRYPDRTGHGLYVHGSIDRLAYVQHYSTTALQNNSI
jgi:hypothetical protein